MKYYVVSDIHGFCTLLKEKLNEVGFFDEIGPKRLVVCGDVFDRGGETLQMQDFLSELIDRDELIFVRGNHEDLLEELTEHVEEWMEQDICYTHHYSNGTVDTLLTLTDMTLSQALMMPKRALLRYRNTVFSKKILPIAKDYFETESYIFVHGWIPSKSTGFGKSITYSYNENWRSATPEEWEKARWINGMKAHADGVREQKTIVCGHYHTSYGHFHLEKSSPEFGENADFSPYIADGIIAIDACTSYSGKINCLIIEDKP